MNENERRMLNFELPSEENTAADFRACLIVQSSKQDA
jgi:hypothetical protein